MTPKMLPADDDILYRSETSLKQKRFPNRRTSVKGRRSLPGIERQQSTLTQGWLPSSALLDGTHNVEDIDDDEDDDEYEGAKSKRKRRKTLPGSGKKAKRSIKKQNTMTQMGFVTSFGSNMDEEEEDADHVMFAASKEADDDDERVPESVSSQMQAAATEDPRKSASSDSDDDKGTNSGRGSVSRSPQSPSPELPMTEVRRPMAEAQHPMSDANPSTPHKHFPDEIPSSNTPQSALLFSTQRNRLSQRSPSKSPLKQRSAKVSLSPVKIMLSPVRETPIKAIEKLFSPWSGSKTDIFRKPALPNTKPTPKLITRTTIPDSDDMPVEETQQVVSLTKPKSPRKLKRVRSTIQDTQYGALGSEVTEDMDTQMDDEDCVPIPDTYQATMEYTGPYYDTVAEALDRDAARFMQTQRMKNVQHAKHRDIVLDTQDGSNEDLLAARTQAPHNVIDFASRQDFGSFVREQQLRSHEQEQPGDVASIQSVSLPSTPEKPKRSHHRPRFHDVEIVDLTADSFEPIVPTTLGSPTVKTGSQAVVDIERLISSPTSKDGYISSSPPMVLGSVDKDMNDEEEVEYLTLNDVATKSAVRNEPNDSVKPPIFSRTSAQAGSHLDPIEENEATAIASSQVSTVGNPTQAFLSQRKRTQIKRELDDLYTATPRVFVGVAEELDLDPDGNDDDVDIDEHVLSDQDLNSGRIEHIDLSDHNEPDDAGSYVDVEEIHDRWGIHEQGTAKPSSPIPVVPGHTADEYDGIALEEISSDLPDHFTSPPHESSQAGDHESQGSNTSPTTHAPEAGMLEQTPKASKVQQPQDVIPKDESSTEITPRARPMLSDKAQGKQPLYHIHDSEDEEEEDEEELPQNNSPQRAPSARINDEGEQYSWNFRPANEILPDTQFSLYIPPIPSSDDYTQGEMRGRGNNLSDQNRQESSEKPGRLTSDVSLAAPPKSSFGWMKKRGVS